MSATVGCGAGHRARATAGRLVIGTLLGSLQGSAWRPERRVEVAQVGGGDQCDRELFRIALQEHYNTIFAKLNFR